MLPADIEQELLRLSRLLEKQTTEVARRALAAAVCDADFKVSSAKALLRSELKTVTEREAEALVETQDLYRAKRNAEAVHGAAVEAGRNYRLQLDVLRSLLAQARAEMQNATGFGG